MFFFSPTTFLSEVDFNALCRRVAVSSKVFGTTSVSSRRILLNVGRGTGIFHNRLCFISLVSDIH